MPSGSTASCSTCQATIASRSRYRSTTRADERRSRPPAAPVAAGVTSAPSRSGSGEVVRPERRTPGSRTSSPAPTHTMICFPACSAASTCRSSSSGLEAARAGLDAGSSTRPAGSAGTDSPAASPGRPSGFKPEGLGLQRPEADPEPGRAARLYRHPLPAVGQRPRGRARRAVREATSARSAGRAARRRAGRQRGPAQRSLPCRAAPARSASCSRLAACVGPARVLARLASQAATAGGGARPGRVRPTPHASRPAPPGSSRSSPISATSIRRRRGTGRRPRRDEARVALLLPGQVRGEQQRCAAAGGLGDRARAGLGDDHVGAAQPVGHVADEPRTVSRPSGPAASAASRRCSRRLRPQMATTSTSANHPRIAAARRAMPPQPSPPPVSTTRNRHSPRPSDRRRAAARGPSGPLQNAAVTGSPVGGPRRGPRRRTAA